MIRFARIFWVLLNHPLVSKNKKLLFVALPIAYWILPDPIPFIFDDLLILALGFWSFVKAGKKDLKRQGKEADIIDVKARVIKDE